MEELTHPSVDEISAMSLTNARAQLESSMRRVGESIRLEGRENRRLTPRAEILDRIVVPHLRSLSILVRGHENEMDAKCYLVEVLSAAAGAKNQTTPAIDLRASDTVDGILRKMPLTDKLAFRVSRPQFTELCELSKKDGPWIALMTLEELKVKWNSDPISLINSLCELRASAKAVSFNIAKEWKNNQLKAFFSTT